MSVLKTSTWSVRFTLPKGDPKGEPNWAKNMTITCVCDAVDMAIALVRAEHPAAMIFSATHKGNDFTLFDPAIAVPAPSSSVVPWGGSTLDNPAADRPCEARSVESLLRDLYAQGCIELTDRSWSLEDILAEVRRHERNESRGVDRVADPDLPARGGDARGVDVHGVAAPVTEAPNAGRSEAKHHRTCASFTLVPKACDCGTAPSSGHAFHALDEQRIESWYASSGKLTACGAVDLAHLVDILDLTRRETIEACAKEACRMAMQIADRIAAPTGSQE